jgi:hypothetical protein
MDRLQEIFKIEDERRFFLKHWMYLRYIMGDCNAVKFRKKLQNNQK